MRFSLRVKLFIVFALISVLLLWIATSTMIGLFEKDKKTYIFDLNVDIAINLSKEIHTYISSKQEDIKVIADIIDHDMALSADDSKSEKLNKVIKIIFDQYQSLLAFLLFSENSLKTQVYNKKKLENVSLTLTDIINKIKTEPFPFEEVNQGKTYLRNITISPNLPSVLLAIPYQMKSFEKPVILVAILSTEKLLNLLTQSSAFEAFMVDSAGRIMLHRNVKDVVNNRDISHLKIVKQLLKGDTIAGAMEYTGDEGNNLLGAYSNVEETGLNVVVQRPAEVAYIALKQLKDKSLNTVLYIFIIALGASILMARRLTGPLEELIGIAREIGKGNYKTDIKIRSGDEIGDLAENFKEMSSKLFIREKELKKTYEQLLSSERTASCYLVGQKISSTLDLEKVFSMSVKYARELANARGALLLVFNDKNNTLVGKVGEGIIPEKVENFIFKPELVYLDDDGKDNKDIGESPLLKEMLVKEFNTKSHIAVLLKLFDRIYGMLILIDKRFGHFTDHESNLLKLFAAQCAIACENARLYKKTEFMAVRDGLTGLFNRHYFAERSKEEFNALKRKSSQLSYFVIDIDFFKKVNDTYGHQAGDEVLKDVAKVLSSSVRDSDIVVRYGGEEMVIMLPGTDKKNAAMLAERIREKIERYPFQYNETKIHITVSIGVSSIDDLNKGMGNAELLKFADQALYRAKENGRNRVEVF